MTIPLFSLCRVQEQPFKTPFLAAVILHVNNSKPEIAVEVIKKAATRTQAAFDTGSWREVKLYLRLFAALSSLFEGDGVFPILDELFNRAADLQAASQLDVSHWILFLEFFTNSNRLLVWNLSRLSSLPSLTLLPLQLLVSNRKLRRY